MTIAQIGEDETLRAIFLEEANGRERPQQAIKQGSVDSYFARDCAGALRSCLVEPVKNAEFGSGIERLASPTPENKVHDLICSASVMIRLPSLGCASS
jgi:hypothetical protein